MFFQNVEEMRKQMAQRLVKLLSTQTDSKAFLPNTFENFTWMYWMKIFSFWKEFMKYSLAGK